MGEMDTLIQAMSDEDLAGMKVKYADNPSVATLIDGILEARNKEQAQAKAKEGFETSLARFVNGVTKKGKPYLPHPEDVYNIYIRWGEVDEPIPDAEADTIYFKDDVVVATEAESDRSEQRQPTTKVHKWIVETNKGFSTAKPTGTSPAASKRAILLSKRDEANPSQLIEVGKFASASKACESLKLTIGGDSATRVLQREGLFIEPYEGTDYTS